jgi:hypothetical protein
MNKSINNEKIDLKLTKKLKGLIYNNGDEKEIKKLFNQINKINLSVFFNNGENIFIYLLKNKKEWIVSLLFEKSSDCMITPISKILDIDTTMDTSYLVSNLLRLCNSSNDIYSNFKNFYKYSLTDLIFKIKQKNGDEFLNNFYKYIDLLPENERNKVSNDFWSDIIYKKKQPVLKYDDIEIYIKTFGLCGFYLDKENKNTNNMVEYGNKTLIGAILTSKQTCLIDFLIKNLTKNVYFSSINNKQLYEFRLIERTLLTNKKIIKSIANELTDNEFSDFFITTAKYGSITLLKYLCKLKNKNFKDYITSNPDLIGNIIINNLNGLWFAPNRFKSIVNSNKNLLFFLKNKKTGLINNNFDKHQIMNILSKVILGGDEIYESNTVNYINKIMPVLYSLGFDFFDKNINEQQKSCFELLKEKKYAFASTLEKQLLIETLGSQEIKNTTKKIKI